MVVERLQSTYFLVCAEGEVRSCTLHGLVCLELEGVHFIPQRLRGLDCLKHGGLQRDCRPPVRGRHV